MTKHNLSSDRRAELAKQRRARVQAERNAMNREMSAAKRAAGVNRQAEKRDTHAARDAESQFRIMPRDNRDLTGWIMGDPIPGDPRCPWRPSASVRPA